MNVHELEEFQGLTLDATHAYLERNGWQNRGGYWQKDADTVMCWSEEMPSAIYNGLARVEKRSVQAILRDMNPRLRRGLPTETDWLANGGEEGWWIGLWSPKNPPRPAEHLAGRPIITRITRNRDYWDWGIPGLGWSQWPGYPGGNDWSFWPCDAGWNKVPWPKVSA